eukprot:14321012-Alexandrium_andersonii.AAC.1
MIEFRGQLSVFIGCLDSPVDGGGGMGYESSCCGPVEANIAGRALAAAAGSWAPLPADGGDLTVGGRVSTADGG